MFEEKTIDKPILLKARLLALITILIFKWKPSNKSRSSNTEASDAETIKFRKVKASLFDVRIKKRKKGGFLIPVY